MESGVPWGYLIENCRIDVAALHVLYNYVMFPECFSGRDKGGCGLNDMATLMEHNHQDNLRWLKENGQDEYRCWSKLHGQFKGKTLVVASCGPSLTHSLPTLYRRRDEFTLLCLNRSMRAFMDPDVKPDFYYFVERRGIPDWVSEVEPHSGSPTTKFDLSGIQMIGTPQCDRNIVQCFDPDLCYWGYTELGSMGHVPELQKLEKYDVKAATTIGNVPFMAWKMGFSKIIFVGCDFALDCHLGDHPEGADKGQVVQPTRMYFDRDWNNTHYSADPNWIKRMMPVMGVENRAVMLDPMLSGHCTYMEAVLDFAHYDGHMWCCNASPRGTLRFNCMPLDEALDHPGFTEEEPVCADSALLEDAVRRGD